MPLNPNNVRQSWRTAFGGIIEYATLVRRNSNGTIDANSVRETWVAFFFTNTESTFAAGESDITEFTGEITLFMRYNETRRKPPKVGDQVRRKDGTDWELLGQKGIQHQLFGSSAFRFDAVKRVPEST